MFPEDERLVDQEHLRYKYVLNTYLTSTCSTGVYCCVTQSLESSLNSWCDNFINGYKKTVADKKLRGVMAISEGKAPLSFSGYSHICRFLVNLIPSSIFNWQLIMFSWLFMVFCWNLIGRSNTVGSIMLQHMDWVLKLR